jgi:hypothetical protein
VSAAEPFATQYDGASMPEARDNEAEEEEDDGGVGVGDRDRGDRGDRGTDDVAVKAEKADDDADAEAVAKRTFA